MDGRREMRKTKTMMKWSEKQEIFWRVMSVRKKRRADKFHEFFLTPHSISCRRFKCSRMMGLLVSQSSPPRNISSITMYTCPIHAKIVNKHARISSRGLRG
jgi:hypothetical protein